MSLVALAVGHFQRERLPDPLAYYSAAGLRLIGRGAWRSALCPFHEDSKPSLRVRVETGAFRCHACGARGGSHAISVAVSALDMATR